jgi:hypothetical protein
MKRFDLDASTPLKQALFETSGHRPDAEYRAKSADANRAVSFNDPVNLSLTIQTHHLGPWTPMRHGPTAPIAAGICSLRGPIPISERIPPCGILIVPVAALPSPFLRVLKLLK